MVGEAIAGDRLVPMASEAAAFWRLRISVFAGWFAVGWATCEALRTLGFSLDAQSLIAFTLGLGLLLIAIETLWRRSHLHHPGDAPHRRREALDWLLTAYLILIWLMWILGLWGLFSLAIVALVLPVAFSVMNRSASHVLRPANDDVNPRTPAGLVTVYVERGLRAVLILAAALFLAHFWEIDLVQLTGRDTLFARMVRGALNAIVVLLVADLLWQVLKTLIDRRLAAAHGTTPLDGEDAAREARLRTLLPILRNIAVRGARGHGGADGAFGPGRADRPPDRRRRRRRRRRRLRRADAGQGRDLRHLLPARRRLPGRRVHRERQLQRHGRVASRLRSIKLRHHRGPLYTVPFGSLGAVQNMSRDWVIDKITLGVTYDTDLDKVQQDHQADRQGARGRSGVRPAHHRAAEDAGRRAVRRLRDPDPA